MTLFIILSVIVIIMLVYFNYKQKILLLQEKNTIVQKHISILWSDMHYQIVAATDNVNYAIATSVLYKSKSILANLPLSWRREIWTETIKRLKEDSRSYNAKSQQSVLLFKKITSEYQQYLKL